MRLYYKSNPNLRIHSIFHVIQTLLLNLKQTPFLNPIQALSIPLNAKPPSKSRNKTLFSNPTLTSTQALSLALTEHPILNSFVDEKCENITYKVIFYYENNYYKYKYTLLLKHTVKLIYRNYEVNLFLKLKKNKKN